MAGVGVAAQIVGHMEGWEVPVHSARCALINVACKQGWTGKILLHEEYDMLCGIVHIVKRSEKRWVATTSWPQCTRRGAHRDHQVFRMSRGETHASVASSLPRTRLGVLGRRARAMRRSPCGIDYEILDALQQTFYLGLGGALRRRRGAPGAHVASKCGCPLLRRRTLYCRAKPCATPRSPYPVCDAIVCGQAPCVASLCVFVI